jgi:hypothetical protein
MWPWICGRLVTVRPLLGIAGAVLLMVVSQLGFLWYRVAEVPDVGEPFNVKAFLASLPPPEKNEAGSLVRRSLVDMAAQRQQVDSELVAELPRAPLPTGGSALAGGPQQGRPGYAGLLDEALRRGWPKQDQVLGRWLDQVFEGAWVGQAERAARLPLGVVEDPRLLRSDSVYSSQPTRCYDMAQLFRARALQLEARGDLGGALKQLETLLGLSRQLKHAAPYTLFLVGAAVENSAVQALGPWLEAIGPNKDLIRAGLALLKRHEAAVPSLAENIKAQYLIERASAPPIQREKGLVSEALLVACQVPWEKERLGRIRDAAFLGQFQASERSRWITPFPWRAAADKNDFRTRMAARLGLPPATGPGSSLSANQWGQFILEARLTGVASVFEMVERNGIQTDNLLRAAQLAIQVALYQADHGRPPEKLDDLVPAYVTALPVSAYRSAPFGYFIYRGEDAALAMLAASTAGLPGSLSGLGVLLTASALTAVGEELETPGEAGGMAGAATGQVPAGPRPGSGAGGSGAAAGPAGDWPGQGVFAPGRLTLFQQALGLPELPGDSDALRPGQRCIGLADAPEFYFSVPVWNKR